MTLWLRLALVAGFAVGPLSPAAAQETATCNLPAYLLTTESLLPKTKQAIEARKLDILVTGTRSSSIVSLEGAAYPQRLLAILREKMPSVDITVSTDIQPKLTAEESAAALPKLIAVKKPNLVIWQTGTVDAMRGIDPEDFRAAMEDGVRTLTQAGTDAILMNLQYSPRTETMISAAPYIDNMRVVAQQHDVPLFDRFGIMRQWNDSGDFDLFSNAPGLDLAKKVHDCLGRGLATFILDAARIKPAELQAK